MIHWFWYDTLARQVEPRRNRCQEKLNERRESFEEDIVHDYVMWRYSIGDVL